MGKDDKLISLASRNIKYCLGCNACRNDLKGYCIIKDDMKEIYEEILKTDKIVIATPIYMNHITGILKNVIDRFNPFSWHDELLKGKTIYLITIGQMSEEENEDIAIKIKEYFESIGEFIGFNVVFLKNLSSGDIETIDSVRGNYGEKLENKTVFLSSVTDCYNKFEEKYELTRKILEDLVDVKCNLNISTKSKLILRDLDLLKQMKNLIVSISINTLDESFKNDMDNATSIKERLETLKELHNNGIYTVLFMSPIFPYITDFKEIIEISNEYIDKYWFENLNLRGDYKTKILCYIQENYPDLIDEYNDIYIKVNKQYWNNLSKEIYEYCESNNIKYINYFYHEKLVENKKRSE